MVSRWIDMPPCLQFVLPVVHPVPLCCHNELPKTHALSFLQPLSGAPLPSRLSRLFTQACAQAGLPNCPSFSLPPPQPSPSSVYFPAAPGRPPTLIPHACAIPSARDALLPPPPAQSSREPLLFLQATPVKPSLPPLHRPPTYLAHTFIITLAAVCYNGFFIFLGSHQTGISCICLYDLTGKVVPCSQWTLRRVCWIEFLCHT